MDYLLLTLGIILAIMGIIGCILPIIPGPPLSFLAIIVLQATRFADFETSLLVILGITALAVTIADYIIPIWATKKFGGTKWGTWGAVLGLCIGLFFPPIGIILGPFFGALAGELTGGASGKKAFSAALGSFIGFLVATGAKLMVSGYMLYLFVKVAISSFA